MKKFICLFIGAALFFSSCDKKENALTNQLGTVVDARSNGSPCSFYIQLDNGSRITPLNIDDDKIKPFLVNQKRVSVSYQVDNGFVSPCNDANAANITNITSAN